MDALQENISETTSDFYFVSPPNYFRVVYNINGHMGEGMLAWKKNPDIIRSGIRALWRQGVAEITRHKGTLIEIRPDQRCPDQVFAADPLLAFIAEDGTKTALISRMKYAERKYEVIRARQAAKAAGFSVIESNCTREGSGDTLFDPNHGIWFIGVGKRTDPGAGKQLQEITGRPVIEIPTSDEHFYHIDTFMSFLPNGHVILYKDAMTPEAYKMICELYPEDKRLEIDRRAAMKFTANPQILTEYLARGEQRHTVVMPKDCPEKVTDKLRAWNYQVEFIDIKAARRAGGGIHCCFQRVWDLRKHPLKTLPEGFLNHITMRNAILPSRKKVIAWGLETRSDFLPGHPKPAYVV